MGSAALSEHVRELATELLADIELSRTTVSQQALKATRLARAIGDDDALEWLAYEVSGVPDTPEGRRHMERTRRWTNEGEGKGWWSPVSEAEATVETLQRTLDVSQVQSLSGDMLLPVSRERMAAQVQISRQILDARTIIERVRSLLHRFARETYYTLEFSSRQQALLASAQADVDGLLSSRIGDSLEKIESIYQRLGEGDAEAISQAMNTCRRLIDSFADAVYPAKPNQTAVVDGESLKVDQRYTKNRIRAYLAQHVTSDSRRTRLRRTLGDIYEKVSAGVHADVTADEARFLFLSTYVMLGEILTAAAASDTAS